MSSHRKNSSKGNQSEQPNRQQSNRGRNNPQLADFIDPIRNRSPRRGDSESRGQNRHQDRREWYWQGRDQPERQSDQRERDYRNLRHDVHRQQYIRLHSSDYAAAVSKERHKSSGESYPSFGQSSQLRAGNKGKVRRDEGSTSGTSTQEASASLNVLKPNPLITKDLTKSVIYESERKKLEKTRDIMDQIKANNPSVRMPFVSSCPILQKEIEKRRAKSQDKRQEQLKKAIQQEKMQNLASSQIVVDADIDPEVFEDEIVEITHNSPAESPPQAQINRDELMEIDSIASTNTSRDQSPGTHKRHSSIVITTPGFQPIQEKVTVEPSVPKEPETIRPKVSKTIPMPNVVETGFGVNAKRFKPVSEKPPGKSIFDRISYVPPKMAGNGSQEQPSTSSGFVNTGFSSPQSNLSKRDRAKKQLEEENELVERQPTMMEDKYRSQEGIKVQKPVRYIVIDCGFGFATVIKADKDSPSAAAAPDFVYVYNYNNSTTWEELSHTDRVYLQEFHRRLDRQGNPMPDQSLDMQLDELEKPVYGTSSATETTFDASWVSIKIEKVFHRNNANIIKQLPAMALNSLKLRATNTPGRYRYSLDFIAGYFQRQKVANNPQISPEYTRNAANSPKVGDVVLLDVFRVQGKLWGKLGQCVVPKRLMHIGQLLDFPAGPVVERLYPTPVEVHNQLVKIGGFGTPLRSVDEYESVFMLRKRAILMHVAASTNIKLKLHQQSQLQVQIAKANDGHPLFYDSHQTIFRAIEEPSKSENINRARALCLGGGSPIVLRKLDNPNQGHNRKRSVPGGGSEASQNQRKPAEDVDKIEYCKSPVIWSGISIHTQNLDGQPWEITAKRSIYQNAVPRNLRQKDREEIQKNRIDLILDRLNLQSEEERNKKRDELARELRNADALQQDLEDVDLAISQQPQPRLRLPRDSSPELTAAERRRIAEDEIKESDELFFHNREIDEDTILVVQEDERRCLDKQLCKSMESWPFTLKDNTLQAKIGAILAGVTTFHRTQEEYENNTINKKIPFLEELELQRLNGNKRNDWGEPDDDSDDGAEAQLGAQNFIQKFANKLKKRRGKAYLKLMRSNNIRNSRQLNIRQMKAIEHLRDGKPFVVIQSPSGTGKTVTLVEAASYQMDVKRGERICLAAEQNTTVLLIMEKVAEIMPELRKKDRMPPFSCFLVRSTAAEMKMPIKEELKQKLSGFLLKDHLLHMINDLPTESDPDGLTSERKKAMQTFVNIMDTDEWAMSDLMAMNRFVLKYNKQLRIIASTISNLMALRFVMDATTLMIDEASQTIADEVEVIIAESKVEQVICAGDRLQIEPYGEFQLRNKGYCFRHASLIAIGWERMKHLAPQDQALVILTQCFRFEAHMRELASFSAYAEFSEPLIAPPEAVEKKNARLARMQFPLPRKGTPVILIHTEEPAVSPDTKSHHNSSHRRIALKIQELLSYYITSQGEITEETMFNCFYLDEKIQLEKDLRKLPANEKKRYEKCTVNTVQAFQGQEKSINIILTSKDQFGKKENRQTAYVTDDRISTTAISRGSKCTALIGNFHVLIDRRTGPMARFIFHAVRRQTPILKEDFLDFAIERIANSRNKPKTNIAWEYDYRNHIVNGDQIFLAEIWVNQIDATFEIPPTEESRQTSIVMPEPIRVMPTVRILPQAQAFIQFGQFQVRPRADSWSNLDQRGGWGSNTSIPSAIGALNINEPAETERLPQNLIDIARDSDLDDEEQETSEPELVEQEDASSESSSSSESQQQNVLSDDVVIDYQRVQQPGEWD